MSEFLVEQRLKELFATLPAISDIDNVSRQPNFDFGSIEDLHVFLVSNRNVVASYPLTWIQTPIISVGKMPRIRSKVKLIFATLSDASTPNAVRLETSFKYILVPMKLNAIKALNRSGFTKLVNRDREKSVNFFNYGLKETASDDESAATDIWDALAFECEIEMDDCPQRTINY